MTRRPCIECGALTTGASRCPEHQHLSTGSRGSTRAWRAVRQAVLTRDSHRCHCGALATEVHHVIAKRNGGTDHPSNLIALCHHHHTTEGNR